MASKTVTRSIIYLIANIATGLPLLENRLAYARSQLTSTKEASSALLLPTRQHGVENRDKVYYISYRKHCNRFAIVRE